MSWLPFLTCLPVTSSFSDLKVIADMTQRDPAARLSVSEYLDILQGKIPGLDAASISASAGPPPVPQPASASGAPLPPPPPPASPLCVFPAYFDSSLYPLFLKMHWNGVTPDERVNLICQVRAELFCLDYVFVWIMLVSMYVCRATETC